MLLKTSLAVLKLPLTFSCVTDNIMLKKTPPKILTNEAPSPNGHNHLAVCLSASRGEYLLAKT